MPSRSLRKPQKPNLKFYQRLTLNQWVWNQFGVENLEKLTQEIKEPHLEEIDGKNGTGFLKQWKLSYLEKYRSIKDNDISRYDSNIVEHLDAINKRREEKIRLKYFQWISLMFVEFYLDLYCNNRENLLASLNNWRENFTDLYRNEFGNADIPPYVESDLNKIALWNATGSGKTLLMHINYLQYLYYSKLVDGASFVLLTPKEGLSLQHLEYFLESGIEVKIYDKNESRLGTDKNSIIVLENTKLADKDGDKTVSVKRFGNQNVLFVDEGHRGSSGNTWQKYRDMLCNEGFSFEYSATFGQAAEAAGDKNLFDRYTKCILFDYSYKYFYKDGYGKDYNIINLKEESDSEQREIYLTGCLLSFYQQKKLFSEKAIDYGPFNIENPLFVFVGASVNAIRTENRQKVSDVVDILLFFKDFLENKSAAIKRIDNILSGTSGLMDNKNRDIFAGAFPYLTKTDFSGSAMYSDMLFMIFNSHLPNATLHIENLKSVNGEIQLRLGDNPPFGIINVGDDSELLKLCKENGFNTASIAFSDGSLFQKLTKPDSSINLLIGAKKFTEGWNCWRVSTMGLMNVGRSEGSEIIQLFGRGIRLKGNSMSLKRSKAWQVDSKGVPVPKYITLLETLNVFGVRADYMKQFKEFLEREGVPNENDKTVTIILPVIKNLPGKLKALRVKDNADYKKDAPIPLLEYDSKVGTVMLDCYAKLQFESSGEHSSWVSNKNEGKIPKDLLLLLDVESLWIKLIQYKKQKNRANLIIKKNAVVELLKQKDWYTLFIPRDELVYSNYADVKRIEKIALTLLQKYLDRFYYVYQNNWEANIVGYEYTDLTDDNFPVEYSITTTDEDFVIWLKQIAEKIDNCKKSGKLPNFKSKHPLDIFSIAEHLYHPLVYKAKNGVEIEVSPVALNDSEKRFVDDLAEYVKKNPTTDKEIYLLRNQSKKGVGFFNNSGFYPDFILWIVSGDKQVITFIDPHGMLNEGIYSAKVQLSRDISTITSDPNCTLRSIMLSPTKLADMPEYGYSEADWNDAGVLFMKDDNEYVSDIMEADYS